MGIINFASMMNKKNHKKKHLRNQVSDAEFNFSALHQTGQVRTFLQKRFKVLEATLNAESFGNPQLCIALLYR